MTDTSLYLVGDVYITRDPPDSMLAHVAPVLRGADVVFANCEAPISDRGTPLLGKPIAGSQFCQPVATAKLLADVGVHAVGVANNHTMDFGPDALLHTLELLAAAGVEHTGGGRDLAQAREPAMVERDGCRFALLSVTSVYLQGFFDATETTPGLNYVKVNTAYLPSPRVFEQPGSPGTATTIVDSASRDRLVADIRRAREVADVVVLSYHWGVSQGYRKLVDYQREMGRLAIEAGADVVFGHHPHVLQGIELHQGKPIFYSVGNFAFEQLHHYYGRETMLINCTVRDRKIVRVAVKPGWINDRCEPTILDLQEGHAAVELLVDTSRELGTELRPAGDELLVV